ncbi:RNase P modulator RnpM [Chloroflexota bacterium]
MTKRTYKAQAPRRTCIACREVKDKSEMIRLVRFTDGEVRIDLSGKLKGRGAYLCQTKECWEIGLKNNNLERTLKTSIKQENREQLGRYADSLP